jgi:hypothetical protein
VLQRVQALYALSMHIQLLSPEIPKNHSHAILLSKYETPHVSTSIHHTHQSEICLYHPLSLLHPYNSTKYYAQPTTPFNSISFHATPFQSNNQHAMVE